MGHWNPSLANEGGNVAVLTHGPDFLWVGAVAYARVGFLHMTVDHKMLYAGPCHTDRYWGKGSRTEIKGPSNW